MMQDKTEKQIKRIGIIGGGAFGTALAINLINKGHETLIWCHDRETADNINQRQNNSRYLPDIVLSPQLKATIDLEDAARDKDIVFLVTPSAFLLDTVRKLVNVPDIAEGRTILACATKGFLTGRDGEPSLILEALENYLPGFYKGNLVYIAGPSHAEELAAGKVTALISASSNPLNSIAVREALSSRMLKVFSSLDVTGVQVCAAIKNVVAIAFGAIEAYGQSTGYVGDNAESFLLAGGLNEMMTIGTAMGATHAETFTSIAGVGDLDVTCRSRYGRNRRFGRSIITENILDGYKDIEDLAARVFDQLGYMPEGVFAAGAANKIALKLNLKLPLFQMLYKILNKEIDAASAIDKLMFG